MSVILIMSVNRRAVAIDQRPKPVAMMRSEKLDHRNMASKMPHMKSREESVIDAQAKFSVKDAANVANDAGLFGFWCMPSSRTICVDMNLKKAGFIIYPESTPTTPGMMITGAGSLGDCDESFCNAADRTLTWTWLNAPSSWVPAYGIWTVASDRDSITWRDATTNAVTSTWQRLEFTCSTQTSSTCSSPLLAPTEVECMHCARNAAVEFGDGNGWTLAGRTSAGSGCRAKTSDEWIAISTSAACDYGQNTPHWLNGGIKGSVQSCIAWCDGTDNCVSINFFDEHQTVYGGNYCELYSTACTTPTNQQQGPQSWRRLPQVTRYWWGDDGANVDNTICRTS